MIQQVFAVHDSKARVFFAPFFQSHVEVAKRAFAQAANDPASQLCVSPADFTLFHLGTFNDELGTFQSFPEHVNLGQASSYKQERSNA